MYIMRHVRTYVRTHVDMITCTRTHVLTHVSAYSFMHTYTHVLTHVRTHAYSIAYTCMVTHTRTYVPIPKWIMRESRPKIPVVM